MYVGAVPQNHTVKFYTMKNVELVALNCAQPVLTKRIAADIIMTYLISYANNSPQAIKARKCFGGMAYAYTPKFYRR